jgi:transposase
VQRLRGYIRAYPKNIIKDDRKIMTAIFYILRTGCRWKAGLMEYDMKKGIEWEWQSVDGAMTKAPLGGEGNGIPLSVVVDGRISGIST